MLKLHSNKAAPLVSPSGSPVTVKDPVVEICGLTKRYGRKTVVDNLITESAGRRWIAGDRRSGSQKVHATSSENSATMPDSV